MAINKITDLWKLWSNYTKDRNNPNEVTAPQIGSYTKEEIDAMLQNISPEGIIPLSRFGNFDGATITTTSLVAGVLKFAETADKYYYDLMINGKLYHLPPKTIDLTGIVTAASGWKGYCYAGLINGVPDYVVSATPLPVNPLRLYIGYVMASANGTVWSRSINGLIWVVDGYYFNSIPAGSSIPTTTNPPHFPGSFLW